MPCVQMKFKQEKRCAGAVYGRQKVSDDGSISHRTEGKAIINGCTDGSKRDVASEIFALTWFF